MDLSPLQRYRRDLEREGFSHDVAQEQAVEALQALYEVLLRVNSQPVGNSLLGRLVGKKPQRELVTGLYFGVG